MRARAQFALALALDIAGGGGVLLLATRHWQTIVTPRSVAFGDDRLDVAGRTIDGTPTALALVALAGAVAVIATSAMARRAIGALVALAGVATIWRAASAMPAVSISRARGLVSDRHPTAASTTAVPQLTTHPVWGALTIVCGMLVVVAGVLVALRGGTWAALSARYESPVGRPDPDEQARQRARADAAMWTALDRGDDPTEPDPRDQQ